MNWRIRLRDCLLFTLLIITLIEILSVNKIVSTYLQNRAALISIKSLDTRPNEQPVSEEICLLRVAAGIHDAAYATSAINLALQATQWNPDNGHAYYLLSEIQAAQGNLPGAIRTLTLARAIIGRDQFLNSRLAALYEAIGDRDRALGYWRESNADMILASDGWQSYYNHDFSTAITAFDLAVQINPTNVHALVGLGQVYYERQQWDQAIVVFQQAIDNRRNARDEKDLSIAHLQMGLIFSERIGDYEGAIKHFMADIALDPGNLWPYVYLGEAFSHQNKYEEAAQWYLLAERIAPSSGYGEAFLGRDSLHQGRIDEAITHLVKATQQNEKNDMAHLNLGIAYYLKGNLDKALAELMRASELAPDNGWVYLSLGDTYLGKEEYNKALQAYETALVLIPSLPGVREKIRHLKDSMNLP